MKINLTDTIKPILSIMVVGLSFAYFFVCFIAKEKPDPQVLIAVVGANGVVLGYWFGSSSGSSGKDKVISDAMAAGVPADAPIKTP